MCVFCVVKCLFVELNVYALMLINVATCYSLSNLETVHGLC